MLLEKVPKQFYLSYVRNTAVDGVVGWHKFSPTSLVQTPVGQLEVQLREW